MPSELSAALKALAKDLAINVPDLNVVHEHWPGPKDVLDMPCASIMVIGSPVLAKMPPNIISKVQDPDEPLNWLVRYKLGMYDLTLQLDMWCEEKKDRDSMYQLIVDYFDRQVLLGTREMPGLNLELSDYFSGVFASYDNVGYNFPEQEESSQRSEWRVRIEILVNHPRVKEMSQSKMTEISIEHEIGDHALVEETNENLQETFELD